MSRAVALVVLALLLGGGGAAGLAVVAAAGGPAAEVVAAAPPEVVPAPSDRDILRAAAIGSKVSVQRDASGGLVMVLPGSYDARTVEQVVPAPATVPPGTAVLLGIGAALGCGAAGLGLRGRWRWSRPVAVLGAGVLAATGTVGLLAGTPHTVLGGTLPVWVLGCAVLVVLGGAATARVARAQALSR